MNATVDNLWVLAGLPNQNCIRGRLDYTIFCTLRAAVRQPATACCRAAARGGLAGSDYTICCTLLAAVRQPAPAGCIAAARGGARWLRLHHLLQSAGRRPAAGSGRLQGCGAWGPAGLDDTIFCTLRTAVRQPASAGCRTAARWGFLLRRHHVLSSASSCPAIGFGWLLEGAHHCTIWPSPRPRTIICDFHLPADFRLDILFPHIFRFLH
jgi:hypothetical protein